jgi:LCP family protein required for cell wall assembly
MRTTLKRGVGRGASHNGNGKAVFPPGALSTVTRYRQPEPSGSSALGLLGRILLVTILVIVSIGLAVAGGAYLYFHQSVASVRAHTAAVVKASKSLDVPLPNHAAIALVIGYDHRANEAKNDPSLSDTIMLVRADPVTKTISLLSFPRDLEVPIYCPRQGVKDDSTGVVVSSADRINSAYSRCDAAGTVLTVKHLTGLPVNYLITVNFHGFKEVVDKMGGVWMDVDRRYYNPPNDGYATINIRPGYQQLSGQQALDFVRFRHTDDDLHRNARQQEFVRAFREQVAKSFSPLDLPSLIGTITKNIEVGEGGHGISGDQVISYALFAQSLPSGHLFQDHTLQKSVVCHNTCTVSSEGMQAAVSQFENPDVGSSKAANAAALGVKVKEKTPPPSKVTVTVLNGNGVTGAAAAAAARLESDGYPIGGTTNAQRHDYARSMVMFVPGWAKEARRLARDSGIRMVSPVDGLRPAQLRGSKVILLLGR